MLIVRVLLILFLVCTNILLADQRIEMARDITAYQISASDYQNSTDYATAVDVYGDYLIVGAPLADDAAENAGKAYIYRWNGSIWTDEYILYASDAEADDQFGCSVAIYNDMAVVGAQFEDTKANNAGAVYAFYFDGIDWTEQKLMATDGEAHNHFGICVDVDAAHIIVGAPHRSEIGNQSGVAYVFERSNNHWTQSEKIYPSIYYSYDYFGCSVAVSNDWIAVGSTGNDVSTYGNSGAVYFFQKQTGSWIETDKVLSNDAATNDEFGYAIDIDGDYSLITAWKDDDNGPGSGAAYIFKRSGTSWLEEEKLLPSNGVTGDRFGNSASLQGDYAVVGAAEHDNGDILDCGSVYVFYRSGTVWNETDILTADEETEEDFFGSDVAINGSTIVVGCSGDDDNGNDSGSVFSFQNNADSFTFSAKIFAGDGFAYRYFGSAVDLDGDWLVVGVPSDKDLGEDAGAIYVYNWNGSSWNEITKFSASDTETGDKFGFSVAINNQDILVGAPYEDAADNNAGAVYYFDYNGTSWDQQKITIADGIAHEHFGHCLDWHNDKAIIGAPNRADNGSQSGAVYFIDRVGNTWQSPVKFVPGDNQIYDFFGEAVSIYNSTAIIGATGDDDNGNCCGAAYIYDLSSDSVEKIFSPDISATDFFGKAVSIYSDYALVSAINDDDNGPNSGSAYIFHFNGSNWNYQQKLTPVELQVGDYFGSSLSLNGDYAAISSVYHSNNGELEGGTIFVYKNVLDSWNILVDLSVPTPNDYDWFGKSITISEDRIAGGWIGNDENGTDTGAVLIFHDLNTVTSISAPADISISVDQTSGVNILFSAVTEATGYKVYGADSPYGSFTDITANGSFSQNGQDMQWTSNISESYNFFKVTAIK